MHVMPSYKSYHFDAFCVANLMSNQENFSLLKLREVADEVNLRHFNWTQWFNCLKSELRLTSVLKEDQKTLLGCGTLKRKEFDSRLMATFGRSRIEFQNIFPDEFLTGLDTGPEGAEWVREQAQKILPQSPFFEFSFGLCVLIFSANGTGLYLFMI